MPVHVKTSALIRRRKFGDTSVKPSRRSEQSLRRRIGFIFADLRHTLMRAHLPAAVGAATHLTTDRQNFVRRVR